VTAVEDAVVGEEKILGLISCFDVTDK